MKKNNDIFEQKLREKLDDFTLTPDPEVWNKIDDRLNSKKDNNVFWLWISGAAAAVIALLLLLNVNVNDGNNEKLPEILTETIKITDPQQETVVPELTAENVEKVNSPKRVSYQKEVTDKKVTIAVQAEIPAIETPAEEKNTEEDSSTPAQIDKVVKPEIKENQLNSLFDEPIVKKKSKRRSGLTLLARSGSGISSNNSPFGNTQSDVIIYHSNKYYGDESGLLSLAAENSSNPTIDEQIEMNYPQDNGTQRIPVSLGITFRRFISDRVSIESGLLYVLTTTDYGSKNSASGWNSWATLKKHYIGVPINIRTTISQEADKRGDIYVSVGGKVERGLAKQLSLNTESGSYGTNTTIREKIDDYRFAANLSLGFEYKIYKNYAVYFEPYLGYYFRETNRFNFGIGAGLAYIW
ncbi:MAG: PorT family protein [Dysgonamonadaceae bacterium]|jgi:hypothetical protein|nr:PorT family protein [Dysgonamonadaceae bacterium]